VSTGLKTNDSTYIACSQQAHIAELFKVDREKFTALSEAMKDFVANG
jgi:hypothetical protein